MFRLFATRGRSAISLAVHGSLGAVLCAVTATPSVADLPDPVEHLINLNNECWQEQHLDETGIHWINYFTPATNTQARSVILNWWSSPGATVTVRGSTIVVKQPVPNTSWRLVKVPCPPPETATSDGVYLGGELVKNSGWVRSTERLAATDVVTNQFTDRADPVGGGFLIGYKFAPWANNVIVSPFASFDFINAPVNHTFIGGSYLGTTANFTGTFGVKAGPQIGAGVWLYGIAGVSVLNETLNINFIPVSSSQSAWVAGGTVGVGGAWQPAFLQGYGHPVSLFAEYQHTWWQDANFNTPAASPFFNYNFRREDDVLKFGFTVSLNAPPAAPAPSYPVKAPMLK